MIAKRALWGVMALGITASRALGADAVEEIVVRGSRTQSFALPVSIDKTGVPLKDIPRSIQVIPRDLIDAQGASLFSDVVHNVSGLAQGGQFAFGFYDRIIIRGLNATILDEGLPDQTSDLGGVTRSLMGVERIEVLKGPGSALFGAAQAGGSINIIRAKPSAKPHARASLQTGSFGLIQANADLGGGLGGGAYQLDLGYRDSDGFRAQGGQAIEIGPSVSWRWIGHETLVRATYRKSESRPDAVGLPFATPKGLGAPLAVPRSTLYYSPFAFANQEAARLALFDTWTLTTSWRVDQRLAYQRREVDLARNSGGAITAIGTGFGLTRRQLRQQRDAVNDVIYQLEPTWTGQVAAIEQTWVTGFEARSVDARTRRSTADLPNINDVFAPRLADGAFNQLAFRCDASHSCSDADLNARFFGAYAIGQLNPTPDWSLRLSARQNWFSTEGRARSAVPANPGQQQPCQPPQRGTQCPWSVGVPVRRDDEPVTYEIGTTYALSPMVTVFVGHANGAYPVFNTEEPQSTAQVPERARQTEAGLRLDLAPTLTLSAAAFHTTRDNVFVVITDAQGNQAPSVFGYRVRGFEADVNAALAPGWVVNANLTRQFPIITRYPQAPANVGNAIPSVPSLLAQIWAAKTLDLGGDLGGLRGSVGLRYHNKAFADVASSRLLPGGPVAACQIAWERRGLNVLVGVDNLTDQRHFPYGAGAGGGAMPAPGRTVFARLSARVS